MHIHGPTDGHGHHGVTSIEDYRELHERVMHEQNSDTFEVTSSRPAYINHGRWVVDCECHGAGLTSRAFNCSCCFDCGRVYLSITFPPDAEQIVACLLKRRDAVTRNWNLGETLEQLEQENIDQEIF